VQSGTQGSGVLPASASARTARLADDLAAGFASALNFDVPSLRSKSGVLAPPDCLLAGNAYFDQQINLIIVVQSRSPGSGVLPASASARTARLAEDLSAEVASG
jgi:hypothetical protein